MKTNLTTIVLAILLTSCISQNLTITKCPISISPSKLGKIPAIIIGGQVAAKPVSFDTANVDADADANISDNTASQNGDAVSQAKEDGKFEVSEEPIKETETVDKPKEKEKEVSGK